MDYKIRQRRNFDCGVATIVSLLKYFHKDYKNYLRVQDNLNTTKKFGTLPNEMLEELTNFGLTVSKGFGQVGYMLLNTDLLYNEKIDYEEENGHWCFYEQKLNRIYMYDVWKDTTKAYKKNEIIELSKYVIIKNKLYNFNIFAVENGI